MPHFLKDDHKPKTTALSLKIIHTRSIPSIYQKSTIMDVSNKHGLKDDEQTQSNDPTSTYSNSSPLPPQQRFLIIGTIPIYFQEDWTAGIGGGLWSTGLAMAQYLQDYGANHVMVNLQRLYEQQQRQPQPLSLLELGSGNGLLAICWLALLMSHQKQHWIQHLVITDTQEHLPLIQRTLEANAHIVKGCEGVTKITVMDHQWGEFEKSQTHQEDDMTFVGVGKLNLETTLRQGRFQFDLIFGSDLAYRPDLYQPLLQSLIVLSRPTTIILIGCTMNDTSPAFFDQARTAGLDYERLSGHLLRPEFRNQFGIFYFQRTRTNA